MSSSLPTEMTIRNFLLKELEKRQVKVLTEYSYNTPIGRLVPDMLLKNGAQYVVETKLGAETKLLDAVVQLYDYSKYTDAKGAFAVLFPEELRRPWTIEMLEKIAVDPKLKYISTAIFKDNRPSQRFVGNLSEIADWISSQVLKPLVVEADTSFAIKVLSEAVDSMTLSLKSLQSKDLEEIFGGKTVFENILQYEEGHYPLDEMKQAAAYLLVNQIIFYHVLSEVGANFEAIDETKVKKPIDLLPYFNQVLKKDYTSIFGFDVASKLPEFSAEAIRNVIVAIKALAPEKIGHDLLGKVFHELIPFNIRKAVAAFYTNNEVAEFLANLSIEKPTDTVIDLACGSGTLLVAAYHRKKQLLCLDGEISLNEHRKFLEYDLTGIDIMPFAAHLAVMHLSLQALLHETERVRVAVWDSTELKPFMEIPAISNELKAAYRRPTLDMFKEGKGIKKDYLKKGSITLEGFGGEEIPLETVDLVIMNPPFTRERRIPEEYKQKLRKRFSDYRKYIHGQLGLYGYFIFLADRFVKNNRRLAMVLPTSLLRIPAASGVRKFLVSHYVIEYIITTLQRSAFSEGAQFREMLLIAKKRKPENNATEKCSIVALKTLPLDPIKAQEYARDIAGRVDELEIGETYENDFSTISIIDQRTLSRTSDNLFVHVSVSDLKLPRTLEKIINKGGKKLINLDSYARKKGIVFSRFDTWFGGTKLHELFLCRPIRAIKAIDKWTIREEHKNAVSVENKYTHERIEIPADSVRFALRRPAGLGLMDISNKLDYVVVESFKKIADLFENRDAKSFNLAKQKWRNFVEEKQGNLLLTQDVDISSVGTRLLAFYSKKPAVGEHMWSFKGLSDSTAKIMALWFNSTIYLLWAMISRVEVRGAWIKFHSYIVNESPIINVETIDAKHKEKLLDIFEEVKSEEVPSTINQLKTRSHSRVKVDKLILEILGFNKEETEQIIDHIYPSLANEIGKLKTLMEG